MIFIYKKINQNLKKITMGCGCKNKGASQPTQTQSGQSQPQPATKQQPTNNTIQESIKKVVEKYYKK